MSNRLVIILFCFSLIFLNTSIKATIIGELDPGIYAGPNRPDYEVNRSKGDLIFSDDKFSNEYIFYLQKSDVLDIYSNWLNYILNANNCSNENFKKDLKYMRYVFRLITLSYLVEANKILFTDMYKYGVKKNSCDVNWMNVFSKCQPIGNEMKKFISRISKDALSLNKQNLKVMNKVKWFNEFTKIKKDNLNGLNLSQNVLNAGCQEMKCENGENVKEILERQCSKNLKLAEMICSEKDQLYGLSYIDLAKDLIMNANVINVLNSEGNGKGCVQRFINSYKLKENVYDDLFLIFPSVYRDLKKKKATYVQGPLYAPGALKEFDDMGLKDFLVVKPKVKPKPKPPKIKIEPTPIPKKVVKIKVTQPPKPTPVPTLKPVPVKKVSAFKKAYEKLLNKNLKNINVNMSDFKDDFLFTLKMNKFLKNQLKGYQTQVALNDMKKFDKLGTKGSPVLLMFIKFLIDNKMHQGLYNINSVLGDKFYVKNDIDKDDRIALVTLKNDESTKYKWNIVILKDLGKK